MRAMRPMLFAIALFSSISTMDLKARVPNDATIIKAGYEASREAQLLENNLIDGEIEFRSELLKLIEKSSKINLNLKGKTLLNYSFGLMPKELLLLGPERMGLSPSLRNAKSITFSTARAKSDLIATLKAEFEKFELKRDSLPKWFIPAEFPVEDKMNKFGRMSEDMKIVQNLGDGTFLGRLDGYDNEEYPTVLVAGMPGAKDFFDGRVISMNCVVMCNRVYRYKTAGNSFRTTEVLDVIDEEKIKKLIPKEDLEPRINKPNPLTLPKPKPPEPRVWSDMSGKFKVSATLKSIADGKVTLLKADGTETVVPIDRLSKSDRDWIDSQEEK